MNPVPPVLSALMQAANGHAGLPPSVQAPGAMPAQMPDQGRQVPQGPQDQSSGSQGGDRQIAEQAANALLAATAQSSDPALKALFTQCLAALHKYLVQDDKEQHQALQGKLSPKLMARAHGA